MAKVLSSIALSAPASPVSAAPSDTFTFTGDPGFTGGGGTQRYDFKWEVNDGGGWVTIAASGTGLTTADTNPLVNSNSPSSNSITVTCSTAGSYTIRISGAPTTGGSYTVVSGTQTVEVTEPLTPTTATPAGYSWAGVVAAVAVSLAAAVGGYSWGGTTAGVTAPVTQVVATPGVYSLAGSTSEIPTQLGTTPGVFGWVGVSAAVPAQVVGSVAGYSWAGAGAVVTEPTSTALVDAVVGAYNWAGIPAGPTTFVVATTGAYSWSATAAEVPGVVSAVPGGAGWAGLSAEVPRVVHAVSGNYSWAGAGADVTAAISATPGVWQWTATAGTLPRYPGPEQVALGVQYGPTGAEYTGTMLPGSSTYLDLTTGRVVKVIGSSTAVLL